MNLLRNLNFTIHPLIILTFALLVFLVPFETLGMDSESMSFTYSKLIGYIFFAFCIIIQPKACFRMPTKAFWYFLLYLTIYFVVGLFQGSIYQKDIIRRTTTLLQMLLFFWVAFNILIYEKNRKIILSALICSCGLVAVLQITGITLTEYNFDAARASFLGEDPNTAGSIFALGAVGLLGFIVRIKKLSWEFIGYLSLLIIIIFAVVKTGSRGAMLSLAGGIICYLAIVRGSILNRMRYGFLILFILISISWFIYNNDAIMFRWAQTVYSGKMAQREIIYPAALEMVMEKPFLGWGPGINLAELGTRVGGYSIKDTHNTFLLVLTEVGILGFLPYIMGIYLCFRNALKAKRQFLDPIPLSLLVTLFLINSSLSWHNRKFHWFVLVFTLASGHLATKINAPINFKPKV